MKTPEELKYKLRIVDNLMNLAWYNHNMILEDNIESSYYNRWSERLEKIAYKLIKEYAKKVCKEQLQDRCKKHGHNMYSVYIMNNSRSHWGQHRCSRCGYEEEWQYDFTI